MKIVIALGIVVLVIALIVWNKKIMKRWHDEELEKEYRKSQDWDKTDWGNKK